MGTAGTYFSHKRSTGFDTTWNFPYFEASGVS